jgi:hypothetical protein
LNVPPVSEKGLVRSSVKSRSFSLEPPNTSRGWNCESVMPARASTTQSYAPHVAR